MAERYPHVFAPLRLGGLTLRNRVFVSAHTTNFGVDFLPTARHVAYHRERARGGAGLIVTEPLRVHDTSLGRAGGLGASRAALPGLADIVTAVRDEGAAVFTQITHTGRHSDNVFRRTASWGPSAVPWHTTGPVPHVMTAADRSEVRRAYVAAALLAVEAGFQGIEVHFGHGHLLHQFISPAANTRTDAYGGTEENRLRFPLEVLDDVLEAVGSSVPVGVRMSADELLPGGQDLAAGRRIAELLSRTRPIAFLDVSIASYTVPSIGHHVADMSEGRAPYLPEALAIAEVAGDVPVLAACRFVTVGDAERALAGGRIAAVAMTRAHIADPHLLAKTARGREDEVRPCVSCNFCIGEIAGHRAITCMMNPAVGREAEWPPVPPPATPARTVLVVGGGPAGMETARVAAERGHRVSLWERDDDLGGQVRTGRRGSGRHELDLLRLYEEHALERLGVTVRTGTEVSAPEVLAAGPDVVVIATGSARRRPLDAFERRSWRGRTVVVVDREGAWTCASVAETIAASGGTVHVVTPATSPLWGVTEYSRMTALERLRALGVDIWTGAVAEFGDGRAVVRSSLVSAETVIHGVTDVIELDPPDALDTLAADLAGSGPAVHVIGDALAPRSLLEAMYEGHALARAL
ncbi:NAD(P)-binding protein [Streptosporangium sp. DT93]|uniref:oxidoreductase n=1 Tax=Streptosporangium sp. DT93 TaxID=3393428 RepID=UPI003CF12EBC